jgi:hypothetical protein
MIKFNKKKPLNFLMQSLQFLIPGKVWDTIGRGLDTFHLLFLLVLLLPERKMNESPALRP